MTLVSDLELPELAYFDPQLRGERFHREMAELAQTGWLARSPLAYFVLDRDAGDFFLRSKQTTFPGKKLAELYDITDGALAEQVERNILHVNGDTHRRLRNLVNPAFTPRAANRWRPVMRSYVEQLHRENVPADGRVEFVEAFAKPYPSMMIATVMGASLDDAPKLHEWSNWIQRQFDGPTLTAQRERIERACEEFYAWAEVLLERRREDPSDDLISTLIAARAHEGSARGSNEGDRLSGRELINLVLNVLVGGVDTTQSQLAHVMRLLAMHPDQWAALRADPDRLVPMAVEETLRFEPITPFTARITLSDVEFRGVTFPEGTIVMVSAFTANRDLVDAGDTDPETFDIEADRGRAKPLTFGAGIHFCLGANLARAELQEALGFFAEHVERIELDGEPVFDSINGIYGLDALPLRLVSH